MIGKIDRILRRKLEVALIGTAAALLIFAFAWFSPSAKEISRLKSQIKSVDERIRFLKESVQIDDDERIKKLRNLIKKYDELKKEYDSSSKPVPLEPDLSGFVEELIEVGKNAQVEFIKVTSGRMRSNKFYQEIPVEVCVRGSFHQIERFMYGIEDMRRLLKVSTFRIESNEKKPPVITADILIRCCVRSVVDEK